MTAGPEGKYLQELVGLSVVVITVHETHWECEDKACLALVYHKNNNKHKALWDIVTIMKHKCSASLLFLIIPPKEKQIF